MQKNVDKRIHRYIIVAFILVLIAFIGVKLYLYKTTNGEGPKITFDNEEIQVETTVGYDDLLEGVTATDANGKDVSDSLTVESMSKLLDDNKRTVNYIAYDENHHIGKASRTIQYTNYESPKLKLSCSPEFYTTDNTVNVLDYITVNDCVDGDISKKTQIKDSEYIEGTAKRTTMNYTISVTNSCGDTVETTLPFIFNVNENADIMPKVLLSDYVVYLKKDGVFNPWDYVKGVQVGSSVFQVKGKKVPKSTEDYKYVKDVIIKQNKIHISSKVNTDESGTYRVTYTTKYNNIEAETMMIVIVE